MTDALKLAEELESAQEERQAELIKKALVLARNLQWLDWDTFDNAAKFAQIGAYLSAADVLRPRVPEQYDFIVERVNGGLTISCRMGADGKRVFAETEPMARAAAAIRAWVAMETQHD